MLTKIERDTFRLALASSNAYLVERVEELDVDEITTDEQVVETQETIDDFLAARGSSTQESTLVGTLHKWEGVQARKGARRGTLYVMDFGHARAAYFDGEA